MAEKEAAEIRWQWYKLGGRERSVAGKEEVVVGEYKLKNV